MAMYRLEAKIFSRSNKGRSVVAGSAYRTATAQRARSVVAGSAYRTGAKLKDDVLNKTFDYVQRVKGVIQSTILAPEGAPAWATASQSLWNTVESGEKRKDAQLAREFILAVPPELSAVEQFDLVVGWAKKELVQEGMITEIALHHPKSGTNPHVHILCTLRRLDGDKFDAKKAREWNDTRMLLHWRESWCDAENAALEKAGRPERVDHRSLKARGIEREPQIKIGVASKAMKEKGIEAIAERFQIVEDIKIMNEVAPLMKAILKNGEVTQVGMGDNWWERSIVFMSRIREQAESFIKNSWRALVSGGRDNEDKNGPDITK